MIGPTAQALLGLGLYVLVLLVLLAGSRVTLVLGGQRRANSFKPDGSDVSPFAQRLCRVHANAYESLPWLGAPLVVALATDRVAVTDPLALWLLAARIGQGIVHLLSTRERAVHLRFSFFLVQVVIAGYLMIRLLTGG
jgi:uncharacterized MAPEG superfamily protein